MYSIGPSSRPLFVQRLFFAPQMRVNKKQLFPRVALSKGSSFSQISSCLKDLVRHLDGRMLCKITKYTMVQLKQLTCILLFGLHSSFYCLNKRLLKNWVNTSTTLHTGFHCLHIKMATMKLISIVQWIW